MEGMRQITIEELKQLFPGASLSTLKRNLEVAGKVLESAEAVVASKVTEKAKRLRQDSKPLLNELEKRFQARLQRCFPDYHIRAQAKRYRLANGIWYKPDFTALLKNEGREFAWEVKGPHAFRGGFENLKVAASTYPEISWWLAWEEGAGWRQQEILP